MQILAQGKIQTSDLLKAFEALVRRQKSFIEYKELHDVKDRFIKIDIESEDDMYVVSYKYLKLDE